MNRTTVKEYGMNLPVGIRQRQKLVKPFRLRPHTAKTDRLLNIWREANKGQHIGWEVCKYLSLAVHSIGEEVFPLDSNGDSSPETLIRIQQLPFGDVMYLWLYSRIVACESKYELSYACTRCGLKAKGIADLWDTDVTTVEEVGDLECEVTLKTGIKLESGKQAMKLVLVPAPFATIMLPGATSESTDSLGYSQLRECVAKVDGEAGYTLSDVELDTLTRMDWLRINRSAGGATAGPKMRTKITCDGSIEDESKPGESKPCANEMEYGLDWSYDDFFDASIPPGSLMT